MARPRTAPRGLEHPGPDEFSLQRLLEALVDPVRRAAVCQLAQAGRDMSCGAFDMPVSRSTATHHFSVLREAGVIHQYYVGTMKMNGLRTAELEARFPGLLQTLISAEDRERSNCGRPG
ncbi:helix-turn-helix transcriptional regulator [Dactylosporangium sp. NPDC051485]|uniref:ArsR/SmtB family transcription factor n=1 Tax=Dactylosporangium sp. NPDC051485 TaxID=3154846 RepID=UPI00343A545D